MANGIYYSMDFHSEVFSEKERSIMVGIPSIGKDNYYWLYGYYGMGNRNKHGSYWTSVQTLWVDKICGNILTRYFARYFAI